MGRGHSRYPHATPRSGPRPLSSPMPTSHPAMLRRLLLLAFLVSGAAAHGDHGEGGGAGCELDPDLRLGADFRPGTVTLDGRADEWGGVAGLELPLLPALDPDQDKEYAGGKMTVKALHDGTNIFFLLQVDGDYTYTKGESKKCSSVALMFQVGDNATYHNMGGCKDMPGSCTSKSCRGHEVDIMHFSVGNAIPGRLYGSNPIDNSAGYGGDRFGHLVDLYSWNPHCRYIDGMGPSGNDTGAQNNWQGAWWHSTFNVHSGFIEEDSPYSTAGQKGTYYFEFSRPLRTTDRLQQDVQFTIGHTSNMAAAFWYPSRGSPWSGHEHYSASCNWLPMDISPASGSGILFSAGHSGGSWDATSAFALLLSFISVCLSAYIGYWVKTRPLPFTPLDRI